MLPFPLSVWVTLGFCSGEDREGLASEYRLCLASAGLGAGSEPAAPGWLWSWSRLAVLCWGATEHRWAQPSSAGELLSNALRYAPEGGYMWECSSGKGCRAKDCLVAFREPHCAVGAAQPLAAGAGPSGHNP